MSTEVKHRLPWPQGATAEEIRALRKLAQALEKPRKDSEVDPTIYLSTFLTDSLYDQPVFDAAGRSLLDLVDQGWTIKAAKNGIDIARDVGLDDSRDEKDRVRRLEHIARDSQLRKPSVQRFLRSMERTREWKGQLVSIFSLMTEGSELANAMGDYLDGQGSAKKVLQPEVQIVETGAICDQTGMSLADIWRYFRHTWANPYSTVPGRSMQILVRDTSRPFHPVMGIAAVSSPVVQIGVRDRWIGWDAEAMYEQMLTQPSREHAQWLKQLLRTWRESIWTEDFVLDGLVSANPKEWTRNEVVAALRSDAEKARSRHRSRPSKQLRALKDLDWRSKAKSDLFRNRRANLLADILRAEISLREFFWPHASRDGLQKALSDPDGSRSIKWILRRAKSERVGSVIADLTVCGALPPYSALAAGKLVAMLASGPTMLRAYRQKYDRPSEIASSIAGRPIIKETRLAYIGTTSLYGVGSSQYNRLFWPRDMQQGVDGGNIGYRRIGKSKSFGSSQFSQQTVEALGRLAEIQTNGFRVNGVFGEGVNPRMRKIRSGFDALGWPGDALLMHGRQRLVYGCALVANLANYAIGRDSEPVYLVNPDMEDDVDRNTQWWMKRWASNRGRNPEVLEAMRTHSLIHPRHHGAIVPSIAVESSEDHALF